MDKKFPGDWKTPEGNPKSSRNCDGILSAHVSEQRDGNGKPLCYAGQWQAPRQLLDVKYSWVCVHSSFSYQLLNPVTQSFYTFWSTAKSTVLPMPHWGAVLTEDDVSRPRASSFSTPCLPIIYGCCAAWKAQTTPTRLEVPWERSLTSVKHSSIKAFLSTRSIRALAGEGKKPHPQHNQPHPPTKRVQAADPQALDASVTHSVPAPPTTDSNAKQRD